MFLAVFLAPLSVVAEHLPIRKYTTADGLPRNEVGCIKRDSHGFLWFCTAEGLSRFDGYTFTNYGVEKGLPDRQVTDFLESRSGEYWVATVDGLCRFNPRAINSRQEGPGWKRPRASGLPMFEVFRPASGEHAQTINGISEDRDGSIWLGTLNGLYRFTPGAGGNFDFVDLGNGKQPIDAMLEDHLGALWVAATDGSLLRRWPDGRIERYTPREGLPGGRVNEILEDREGRLWVASWSGLYRLAAHPKPGRRVVERLFTPRDGLLYSPGGGLPPNSVGPMFQSLDGKLWVGTGAGLGELITGDGKQPERFRTYTAAQGLGPSGAIAEDAAGNIWVGTAKGVLKWVRTGFTAYDVQDGLRGNAISSIFEDRQGHVCVVTEDPSGRARFINRFEGQRFIPIEPKVPARIKAFTWGTAQIHFQDHTGAWWIATGYGLCRYPKVRRVEDLAHTLPEAIYAKRDGLPGGDIFRLYEDSRGDVWVSVTGSDAVTRWSRADWSFHNFARDAEGRPLGTPICFSEDGKGNLWMGLFWHDVARYRNGRFDVFTTADGLPRGVIRSIYTDHAGRLWLASGRGGLLRVDNPSAERPKFVGYTAAQGLSSNETNCVTEDTRGRIYVGTGRGVDRLEPETDHIQHYFPAEGLPLELSARVAFRDRDGALWFGGYGGVSRLLPQPEQPQSPPPIRITSLGVRGLRYPVSELGETNLAVPTLEPGQNQIDLGFASLNFAAGDVIRFQTKLEGADRDWSPPTELRTVNYASLSPGAYRFLVRAVNSEGVTSPSPASVAFVLLPPVWRRWWFLTLAALLTAAAAYAIYQSHLKRLLELERVRTRIATDLHDDIGSSLTQIAILSEVARQRAGASEPQLNEPLTKIGDLSRELVDSMSDIVWAINPRRDRLSDLAGRMRRFASDVFSARNIEFNFLAPPEGADASLHADVRRQVFLVLKESVNNIARHSGSHHVEITLQIEGNQLLLKVSDDGQGFDLTRAGDGGVWASGHGLPSMERRAQSLGGKLHVVSQPGGGTCILLEVPVVPS